ncbi:MAG: LON peptidase substrate-binding domain-containing protein [Ilumatobacteraceae bacterium]
MTLSPAFPLGTAFLPGDAVVLRVFESRYLEMMTVVLNGERQFVSALISGGSEVGGGDHRFNEGVLVEVDHVEEADIGLMMYGRAVHAVTIVRWNDDESYPRAEYEHQRFSPGTSLDHLDAEHVLSALFDDLEGFFALLTSFNIPTPVTPELARSLMPQSLNGLEASEVWDLFWTLSRLLPSTPMSRCELLRDQPLEARVRRAREEIEHLSDIIRFRYGN